MLRLGTITRNTGAGKKTEEKCHPGKSMFRKAEKKNSLNEEHGTRDHSSVIAKEEAPEGAERCEGEHEELGPLHEPYVRHQVLLARHVHVGLVFGHGC